MHKSFGSVQAVRGADFVVGPGQLHALLGENGAGKSTLMHIAAGLVRADRGEIVIDGATRTLASPRDARRHGIGMVHQHSTSVPAFSVRENIALAAGWTLRPAELRKRVRQLENRVNIALDPDAPTETLSVADLERLEILKVLATNASVLLLDEPTGSLAPSEADSFLALIRGLTATGTSAVLITHKLDEALRYADQITVLRRGKVVLTAPAGELTAAALATAMLGEIPMSHAVASAGRSGALVVEAQGLAVSALDGRGSGLLDATFDLREGETVGIAAIEGNGAAELIRAVAGLTQPSAGSLRVTRPVGFVPADRTTEGLIGEFSLSENLTLGLGDEAPWVTGGRIDLRGAQAGAAGIIQRYGIVASGPKAPAHSLSGGNQQKLLLARAIELKPKVLVAENPGRGLDIRAAEYAFQQLRAGAAAGAGVLIQGSDLDELLEWCDRILVVAKGRVHVVSPGVSRDVIGHLMLGQR